MAFYFRPQNDFWLAMRLVNCIALFAVFVKFLYFVCYEYNLEGILNMNRFSLVVCWPVFFSLRKSTSQRIIVVCVVQFNYHFTWNIWCSPDEYGGEKREKERLRWKIQRKWSFWHSSFREKWIQPLEKTDTEGGIHSQIDTATLSPVACDFVDGSNDISRELLWRAID